MGARAIEKRDVRIAQTKVVRAIAFTFGAVVGPLLLMYLLIAADMRSDLSELRSRQTNFGDGAALVDWRELAVNDENGCQRPAAQLPSGRVRMLGYMMDGYQPARDGTEVDMFILMPQAGELLHPAHRVPDEMVEVWLDGSRSVTYANRSLVWVEGNLQRARQKALVGMACWAMREGTVEIASERDIALWFGP